MIRLFMLVLLAAGLAAAESARLPTLAEIDSLLAAAQRWSLAQVQPDGALVDAKSLRIGITAFAATSLAREPGSQATQAAVVAAARWLASRRQPDGGIYDPNEGLGNYGAAITLQLVPHLRSEDRAAFEVPRMQSYLWGNQNPDAGTLGSGGIGYGDKGKGYEDLSNTAYAVQALRSSGIPAADPRLQAALTFLERCQDLSAVNQQPWVKNSGGGVYGPQDAVKSFSKGDESQAARYTPTGSMTYALISGYLSLDLRADDPRVKAALGWIGSRWGFDANPGMDPGKERQGLFHTWALAATTFDLLSAPTLRLADGREVDWRADLWQAIASRAQFTADRQQALWINDAPRWAEGIPELATAYAIRAMKAIRRSLATP